MRRHALIVVTLGLLLASAPAGAHGPAPVALSVLSVDDEGAGVMHTSIGLASARGDGTYAYVCPSRWDGNERALAYGADGAVLVLSLGVAYVSRDAGCTFTALDVGGYAVGAASWADGFALLAEDAAAAERFVVQVGERGPAPLTLELPAPADGLFAHEGALWLGGAGPPTFVARWDGTRLELPWVGSFVEEVRRARPVGAEAEAVWVETAAAELALVRVDAGGPGPPRAFERSRHGPIVVGERTLALFDGVLHAWTGSAWRAEGERPWTCLQREAGRSFACSLDGTVELTSEGAVPFFSMRQLGPPRACGGDAEQTQCTREWAHFGGESGWLETDPARDATSERPPMGCNAGGGTPGPGLAWALLLGAALRRRAARSRPPPS